MILGLDASTTTVGFAFNENNSIVKAGFVDISHLESNKEKSLFVIDYLNELPCAITEIHLEASLSGFAYGKTTQQVIIKLARFNAIFEYILSETYDSQIILLPAVSARKNVLGKSKIKGMKAKDFVKLYLSEKIKLSDFDKTTKKGMWDKRNFDMYDAMIMALASSTIVK